MLVPFILVSLSAVTVYTSVVPTSSCSYRSGRKVALCTHTESVQSVKVCWCCSCWSVRRYTARIDPCSLAENPLDSPRPSAYRKPRILLSDWGGTTEHSTWRRATVRSFTGFRDLSTSLFRRPITYAWWRYLGLNWRYIGFTLQIEAARINFFTISTRVAYVHYR